MFPPIVAVVALQRFPGIIENAALFPERGYNVIVLRPWCWPLKQAKYWISDMETLESILIREDGWVVGGGVG